MTNIPQHVAIIMDGNGRWAKKRGLPKIAGHRAGVSSIQEAITAAKELGVKALTLYTFSTENWKRPSQEVNALFKLVEEYVDKESKRLIDNDIRFSVIGRPDNVPPLIYKRLHDLAEATKNNNGLWLNLAFNYGGRTEILDAVRHIAEEVKEGRLALNDINESVFKSALYTKNLPDPDLLIRTSGEFRISNFLLWQISYAEIYVTQKLWPDFKKEDLREAIAEYGRRTRRFGG